ncbi:MAG: hypothetical protein LWW85_12375, partial [Marinilabiliales bacterium]|nr:hypothetical protein [Marinilabiliales bacterium]
GVAIAYCSNGINYPMNDILIGVLSICFGKPYQLPDFSKKPMVVDNLEPYKGVYASKQLPLKLTIASQGNQLTAQGTGQPAFPLEPSDKHTFRFDKAGVVIVFDPDKGTLTLKQGGGEFLFEREK